MKKVLIGLGILVLLVVVAVGGIGWYVYSNLDSLVEQAIETAGSEAVGSKIEVDSVSIDLQGGDVSIYGFSVANPAGFSGGDMVRFDELSVDLDLTRISRELVRINSIVARSPYVKYETVAGGSNVDAVLSRFESGESSEPAESSADVPDLSIGEVLVENIQGSLSHDRLPRELDVSLGDISLQNLEGTPQEIAKQVMRPIMAQISSRARDALIDALGEDIEGMAREELENLQNRAEGELDEVQNRLEEEIGSDAADRLREGVGNLFN